MTDEGGMTKSIGKLGLTKTTKTPQQRRQESAETWARIQKDPRPFDPKLGDQAVKLLDKAITIFRERRANVMNQLADDIETIKYANQEIGWIDKKVKNLRDHKTACQTRLEEVRIALKKFGEVPDEKKADYEDTRNRSVMPLLGVSQAAVKHSSLESIRCQNREAESMLAMVRGFDMKVNRPKEENSKRATTAPGTTRYELAQTIRRLPPVRKKGKQVED